MATENLEVPVPGNIADNTVQEIPSAPLRGRSQKRQRLVSRAVLWLLLAAVSLVMVIPFAWMVFTALRSPAELGEVNPPFIPRTWHFENFLRALKAAPFHIYARNSFIIGAGQVITTLLFGASAGYALAKLRFRAAPWIFGWFLATMMIPFYAIVILSLIHISEPTRQAEISYA